MEKKYRYIIRQTLYISSIQLLLGLYSSHCVGWPVVILDSATVTVFITHVKYEPLPVDLRHPWCACPLALQWLRF